MNSLLVALMLHCDNGAQCAHKDGKHADAKAEHSECTGAHAEAAKPAAADAKTEVISRGEKLKGLKPVTFTELLSAPSSFDGKTVAVEAPVRQVCSKKGCWMELGTADSAGVRVTFKDYGFFMPLDSAGKKAKLEGTVKVAELSEAKAKHYEAEGAKVAKEKDGKYREVQLVASGVELR